MKLSEFDYALPEGLIAQYPAERREKCRLMALDRKTGSISHKTFEDIAGYFNKGDLLVLNNTKVIPARLFGKRRTGGKVELFLLEKEGPTCEALTRPSGRLKEGEKIILESGDEVEVLNRGEVGRFVRFGRALDDILMEAGHIPLPPYIKREDEESDKHNYQTVYADKEGATASPTAGLHFTEALIEEIRGRGVRIEYVTLHTNYGTFAPIMTEDVERHKMHKERFELPGETAEAVNETKKNGGRIFAVGTTTTRTLEHCASLGTPFGRLRACPERSRGTQCEMRHAKGHTGFYIYPGYGFTVVDCMITNFHLPKSTLMLLVCAFAGKQLIFEAYRKAVEARYRFFSYGDAMLIL